MRFALLLIAGVLALTGCKKTPQEAARSALEKGKSYLSKKDYSHALLEFRIALKNSPMNAEAYYQAGLTYLTILDVPAAYVNFKKAAELDAKHAGAQSRLAELLSASHDPERLREASSIASQVLKLLPDDVAARNSLAISTFELGDREGAETALREMLASGTADARTVVNLALMRMYSKDRAGALAVLREGSEKNPLSSDLALILGRMYAAERDSAAAEQQFQRATAVDPKNALCWATLGSYYAALQRGSDAEKAYRTAASLGDSKFGHVLALYYWSIRNVEGALREFERLAAADPKDRAARDRLVAAYRQLNREADADRVLQKAYASNPKDREAVLGHAQSLLRMGKEEEAAATLRVVVSDSNDAYDAHYLLSKIYAAKRQYRLQQQELDEVLKISPMHLAARLDLSQSQVALGRHAAALDVLDRAPKEQRGSVPWKIAHNWALLSKGDVEAARASIAETLRQGPIPEALLQRAFLAMQSKQPQAARGDLLKVLEMEPQSLRALDGLASTYLAEGTMEGAVRAVGAHVAKWPKSLALQFSYSMWQSRAGKVADARATLTALKKAFPEEPRIEIRLGELALASGDLEGARKFLVPVVNKNGKIARAQMLLGHVESIGGQADAAIARYRTVIDLEPENAEALNNLASLLSGKAQWLDEALRYAQRAKELAPAESSVSDTLGWVLYQKGLYSAAVQQLEAASKGPNPVAKYHLAMAYAKTGNRAGAAGMFAQAKKLAPAMPEARQAEELLQRQ